MQATVNPRAGRRRLRRDAGLTLLTTDPACHAIFSAMVRLMALVIAGTVLASCTGGVMGDYMPHWAGGLPKDLPPRPGTPEYDAYRQKLDAEAARDKSKDPPRASKTDTEKKGYAPIGGQADP
jgi:hypothetical protein